MKHMLTQSTLFSVAACVLGLPSWGIPSTANAQLLVPPVSTCNLKGDVSITVAGVRQSFPLLCVNSSLRTSRGTSNGTLNNVSAGPLALETLTASSKWTSTDAFEGQTKAVGVGFIQTTGLFQGFRCSGRPAAICDVTASVGNLTIGGQQIAVPAEPIPQNYQIQLANVQFPVSIGGATEYVPLNGKITLNRVDYEEADPDALIDFAYLDHSSFFLDLAGSIPGAKVDLRVYDQSFWNRSNVTSITINNLTPAAWRAGEL